MWFANCAFNEFDSNCHPTLCGIKCQMLEWHEENLENTGHSYLLEFLLNGFDVSCNKKDGCGFIDNNDLDKNFHDELKRQIANDQHTHPLSLCHPDPIETYALVKNLKKKCLISKYIDLRKKITAVQKDFKDTFNEDIDSLEGIGNDKS